MHRLEVRESQCDDQLHLTISGVYFNSTKALRTPKTFVKDDCIVVEVHSKMPSKRTSGSLNLSLPVDAHIRAVAFGTPEDVIWRRQN